MRQFLRNVKVLHEKFQLPGVGGGEGGFEVIKSEV